MSLTLSSRRYRNRHVLVSPFYGWGWSHTDPDSAPFTYEESVGPSPFHMLITSFCWERWRIRGGVGVVREPGHTYDGLLITFRTHDYTLRDFTDRHAEYDVTISLRAQGAVSSRQEEPPQVYGYANIWDDERRPASHRFWGAPT